MTPTPITNADDDDRQRRGGGACATTTALAKDANVGDGAVGETHVGAAFVVRARWQEGADIGPVVLPNADARLIDLKQALYDATWMRSEDAVGRGGGAPNAAAAGLKPPSVEYVRALMNGKILGPDHKRLRAFGLVCDNNERVIHIVVGSRPYDDGERSRSQDASTKSSSGANDQPMCCSIM